MLAKHITRVFKQFHWLKYLKLDELVDYFDEFFLPKNFVNTFIKIICTWSVEQLTRIFHFNLSSLIASNF